MRIDEVIDELKWLKGRTNQEKTLTAIDEVCGYYYSEIKPESKTLVDDDIGIVADAIPKPCKEY